MTDVRCANHPQRGAWMTRVVDGANVWLCGECLGIHVEPGPMPYTRPERRTGRNEPCPCGSGKKAKRCCGTKSNPRAARGGAT